MKIGVFDSGKGGEFVAKELQKIRPNDTFVLALDQKHLPYGAKSQNEVIKYTELTIKSIIDSCDIIIIACNTATALAIDYLRKKYPQTTFIGFEPMVKPAANSTLTKSIAVFATDATKKSERYQKLKAKYAQNINVYEPNCSKWAELIEGNLWGVDQILSILEILEEQKVDKIVLACTHYLVVKDVIAQAVDGLKIDVLQPIEAINRQINRLLKRIY